MSLSLAKTTKFLSYTDGRDKLYKFLHYGSKFLGWFFASFLKNQGQGEYFYNIDKTISDGRKMIRFFKYIDELQKLGTMKETRSLFILGNVGKCTFMALYYLLNNISWLAAHKIVEANEKKWMKASLYCWLLGLLCALAMDVTLYRENQRNQLKASRGKKEVTKELAHLRAQQQTLKLTLIREVANILISSSLVEINPIGNNGLTGLAGVIEASLGAYQIWNTKCG